MEEKKGFACARCGFSCRQKVKLSKSDIKLLSKSPFVKKQKLSTLDFAELDPFESAYGDHALRMHGGACIFLSFDTDKKAHCAVYEHRPQICRMYPFISGQKLPCTALGDRLG